MKNIIKAHYIFIILFESYGDENLSNEILKSEMFSLSRQTETLILILSNQSVVKDKIKEGNNAEKFIHFYLKSMEIDIIKSAT